MWPAWRGEVRVGCVVPGLGCGAIRAGPFPLPGGGRFLWRVGGTVGLLPRWTAGCWPCCRGVVLPGGYWAGSPSPAHGAVEVCPGTVGV